MKKNIIFTSIILSLLLTFVSCKVPFDASKNESKYVEVQLNIREYEKDKDSSILNDSRTVMPGAYNKTVTRYELIGNITTEGRADSVKEEWTSYEAMNAATLKLFKGSWNFTLNAYYEEASEEKLYATGQLNDVILTVYNEDEKNVSTLSFSMVYAISKDDNTGLEINVKVPYEKVYATRVYLYLYDNATSAWNQVHSTNVGSSGNSERTTSTVTYRRIDISAGDYKVKFDFSTKKQGSASSEVTATRIYFVKVVSGEVSKGDFTVSDLNNKYGISYVDNVPEGETLSVATDYTRPDEFNKSTTVILPDANKLFCEHYIFGGWYKEEDLSGTQVSEIASGTEAAVTLYAKWIPKTYKVKFFDYAGNQSEAKTFTGGNSEVELSYGSVISNPTSKISFVDENEATFAGWFSDSKCETSVTNKSVHQDNFSEDSDGDGKNDTIVLYAKWNYKYLYIDPHNDAGTSLDTNNGGTPDTAFTTFSEVKKYTAGNDKIEKVFLLSPYYIDSVEDASELSGLSLSNVVLARYSSFTTGNMITFASVNSTVENLILDNASTELAIEVENPINVTLIDCVVLADSNSGVSVSSKGNLYLEGCIHLGKIYLDKSSSTHGYIYPTDISLYGTYSKAGIISIDSEKYPVKYYASEIPESYVTVLKGMNAGDYSYHYFDVGEADYGIAITSDESEGFIYWTKDPDQISGQLSVIDDDIEFTISASEVINSTETILRVSAMHKTQDGINIMLDSLPAANWNIQVFAGSGHTDLISSYPELFEKQISDDTTQTPAVYTRQLKVKAGVGEGTVLRVYVSIIYNGRTYGAYFPVVVKGAE